MNRNDRAEEFAFRNVPEGAPAIRRLQFFNAYVLVDERVGQVRARGIGEQGLRDNLEGITAAAQEQLEVEELAVKIENGEEA